MQVKEINPFLRYAQRILFQPAGRWVRPLDARIFYIQSGTGQLNIGEGVYPLRAGTLALINAGELYCLERGEQLDMVILNFDYTQRNAGHTAYLRPFSTYGEFPAAFAHEPVEDCPLLNAPIVLYDADYLAQPLREIVQVCGTQESFYQERASSLLRLLLISIVRTKLLTCKNCSKVAENLIQYLQDHYAEHLTSAQIAKVFNYHNYHINRIMRSATGTTVHKYLINYRVIVSKSYLVNTDLSIKEIADRVGFESDAHFSSTFKRIAGLSPSAFRNLHRGIL